VTVPCGAKVSRSSSSDASLTTFRTYSRLDSCVFSFVGLDCARQTVSCLSYKLCCTRKHAETAWGDA
jgi:hypothetical protein